MIANIFDDLSGATAEGEGDSFPKISRKPTLRWFPATKGEICTAKIWMLILRIFNWDFLKLLQKGNLGA